MWFSWRAAVALAVIATLVTAYLSLRPDVIIEPSAMLVQSNPMSTLFTIVNGSPFTAYDLDLAYRFDRVSFGPDEVPNAPFPPRAFYTTGYGEKFFTAAKGARIGPNSKRNVSLSAVAAVGGSKHDPLMGIKEAYITFHLKYRSMLWPWKREKTICFGSALDEHHDVQWVYTPCGLGGLLLFKNKEEVEKFVKERQGDLGLSGGP